MDAPSQKAMSKTKSEISSGLGPAVAWIWALGSGFWREKGGWDWTGLQRVKWQAVR
jgi:hypothetical protein